MFDLTMSIEEKKVSLLERLENSMAVMDISTYQKAENVVVKCKSYDQLDIAEKFIDILLAK